MDPLNIRNYSQRTNFKCGSESLKLLPFFVTTINIPGITTDIQTIGGRGGAAANFSPANLTFNNLSIEVLVDEDYKIFEEIISSVHINVENDSFENKYFDFWMELNNDMGKKVMKIEFYNCLIDSIGDLSLATNDDSTENTFSVEIKFDYYKIINDKTPTLRT